MGERGELCEKWVSGERGNGLGRRGERCRRVLERWRGIER